MKTKLAITNVSKLFPCISIVIWHLFQTTLLDKILLSIITHSFISLKKVIFQLIVTHSHIFSIAII